MNEDILIGKYKLYGYKEGYTPIKLDNKLCDIGHFLEDNLEEINKEENIYSLKEMKSKAREFYESKLNLRNVYYCNEKIYYLFINSFLCSSIDKTIDIQKKITKNISPFNIPIKLFDKSEETAYLCQMVTVINNEDYLSKANPIISNIFLSKRITPITISAYIHEIMHTQHTKNNINNYHNCEILSLLLEDIYLYENKDNRLFHKQQIIKYNTLLNSLYTIYNDEDYEKKQVASSYLQSILLEQNLFEKYISSSINMNTIMACIQLIINDKINVENMLNYFDINLDNSKEISLIKKCIDR